jgi:hypothetical protein
MAALRRELDARPTIAIALVTGLVGTIGVVLGFVLEPERALAAYLAAWCAVATAAIGGLVMLMIGYAANARWPAVVRRLGEAIAGGILPAAILVIPLLVGASDVWPWVHPEARYVQAVALKAGWLSLPFFVARTIVYLAVCIVPAELLRRWSRRRDEHPEPTSVASPGSAGARSSPEGSAQPIDALPRERKLSSLMLLAVALALTFAAFDWLMSLDPDWWSSAFGLYVLTATMMSGLALTTVLAWRGVASGAMPVAPSHFHAMGRLLHAFVILWTYIAYFQAMLIQIANKPSEVEFYVLRNGDGWKFVTTLLVVTAFAIPFPLLLSRRMKRRAGYVAGISILLLFSHYLDMWWLVVPRVSPEPVPSWTDLSAICAIAGLVTAAAAWRMRGVPLFPVGDPFLAEGLRYETSV